MTSNLMTACQAFAVFSVIGFTLFVKGALKSQQAAEGLLDACYVILMECVCISAGLPQEGGTEGNGLDGLAKACSMHSDGCISQWHPSA